MCSRFEINRTPKDVSLRFDVAVPPEFAPMAEVRPTNRVPVIGAPGEAAMLRWGLDVDWDAKPLINARAETLAERKTFRPLLERRCLVPASAYFEWRSDGGRKIKTRIHLADGDADGAPALFAFAGLMSDDRFTIVTSAPAPAIAHIYGRMPVILAAGDEARWVAPDVPFAEVAPLLKPAPDARLAWADAEPPPRQGELFS